MGKTPKHQGGKMSRPYNAKNVHVSKSVSGNQRLTRSGRKFNSAEYVSRKLSSKYGSQHLRLQNQSYLIGVTRGHRKLPYFAQPHKLSKKRHYLHSRELQRQKMQEPGAEEATSKTSINIENETNENNDLPEENLTSNKDTVEGVTENPEADRKGEETEVYTVAEEEIPIEANSEESVVECVSENKDNQTAVKLQDPKKNVEVESEINIETSEEVGVENNHNNSCESLAVEDGISGDSGYDKTTNLDDRLLNSVDCPPDCVTEMSEENFIATETESLVDNDLKTQSYSDVESSEDEVEAVTSSEHKKAEVQFQEVADTFKKELECSDVKIVLKSPLLSLGSNIRATSGRRPVRKHVLSDNVETYNHDVPTGNIHNSHSSTTKDNEFILNESCMENDSYRTKKRAAPSDVFVDTKKQKVMDITENSGLLSVISSPLQLLKYKIKSQENHSSFSNDVSEDEHISKTMSKKLEGNSREKVNTLSVDEIHTPAYKNWCSIM